MEVEPAGAPPHARHEHYFCTLLCMGGELLHELRHIVVHATCNRDPLSTWERCIGHDSVGC